MRYLIILLFAPLICLGQSNKKEINKLLKELNSKLTFESPSVSESYVFDVNDVGILQIERTITTPKVATRKFIYSINLKDTDYTLDLQPHDNDNLYAFVFKDKQVNKNIKQVIKVKKLNASIPEKTETDSFKTLVIPITFTIKDEDIKLCSDAIAKIFELAKNESTYASSYKH